MNQAHPGMNDVAAQPNLSVDFPRFHICMCKTGLILSKVAAICINLELRARHHANSPPSASSPFARRHVFADAGSLDHDGR
jgi:hypothetical protein